MDIRLELKYLTELGEGNHKAFDALFAWYHPKLIYFFNGFLKDEEMACDMAQEIFFKVWINRGTISKVDSFGKYLFRMARNMIYDYFDHSLIREKYNTKHRQEIVVYTDMIEEELYAEELSLLIDIVIEKMPPQRKRIFEMSRKEGLTNQEIAEELNINKRTVENHLTQALSDIRRVISGAIHIFL